MLDKKNEAAGIEVFYFLPTTAEKGELRGMNVQAIADLHQVCTEGLRYKYALCLSCGLTSRNLSPVHNRGLALSAYLREKWVF